MTSQVSVLIVGAGPVGLMMACELGRHGVPVRIIDKKKERTQSSNATWIQSRTLELFDMVGIADRFLKVGYPCEAINFYSHCKHLVNIPLKDLESPYPFILMLPQSETERLLEARLTELNITVERTSELIDIKQADVGVVSTIQSVHGVETIVSHWVVACDGANSTVRQKTQIPFLGNDVAEQFMIADAQMSSFLPNNEMHIFFDKGTVFPDKATVFAAFPWGANQYRIAANLYQSHPRQSYTEHEVKEAVAERTNGDYTVDAVSWISPFWIHGKIAGQIRQGSIFLVGDAAHIHSPAGGQGMNTGLQDAFNLAWKLALVVHGKASSGLLDTYQAERYPVIEQVVTQTVSLTNSVLFDKSFVTQLKKFSKRIASHSAKAKKIGMDLTQLNINYKNSPIIYYQQRRSTKSPRPGMRAPDISITNQESLYARLRSTQHTLLLFTGVTPTKSHLAKIKELQQGIVAGFSGLVKTWVIASDTSGSFDHLIVDTTGIIHQCYQVKKPAVYVIRPDNYIGYCSDKLDLGSVEEFLRNYLL